MMILDLLFCMIVPLESILEFINSDKEFSTNNSANTLNNQGQESEHQNINFFMILRKNNLNHFITEAINAFQAIIMILILYMFCRFDLRASKMKYNERSIYGLISFLILLSGRFLVQYFTVFQIITIRCGFKNLNC